MVKKVFIIHGWGGSPEEPMHQWLKEELGEKGFEVTVPKMPNPEYPEISKWINKLKEEVKSPDKNTYFIGHSIGCQTIMRYLEEIPNKIGGAVFIAPWFNLKGLGKEEEKVAKPWIKTPINLSKVKLNINKLVAIFSDNDPFVPSTETKIFKRKLNAEIIIEKEKGHFTEDDGVDSNSVALTKLLEISK